MVGLRSLFWVQVWGVLCGGVLGALRTHQAARHLLAKNQALLSQGVPALPGTGHLDTLASWAPAGAGALFFGLSLGLGWSTLLGLATRGLGVLPAHWGRRAPKALLLIPLLPLALGDTGLALLAAAIVAVALACLPPPEAAPGVTWNRGLALVVLAAGLWPWAAAPEGPFTRLRDQVLFESEAGRALDRFYYEWTLYPAEAIKPLAALSQPTVRVGDGIPADQRTRFCRDALRLGILCIDADSAAADLALVAAESGPELWAGDTAEAWPGGAAAQGETWKRLSQLADSARPLRRATALGLMMGCPLALLWLLSSPAATAARRLRAGPRGRWMAGMLPAFLLAGGLAYSSRPDPQIQALRAGLAPDSVLTPDRLRTHLASERPLERFLAARAAGNSGPAATPLLLPALTDPVLNVRYAAAQSLGASGGSEARGALLELLNGPTEWYVKERAYAGLWRLGWRPR